MLVGQLFVSPSNTSSEWIRPITFQEAVIQTNLFFGYRNLDGCQDFTLQLVLYTVTGSPWPPYSYVIMLKYRL
jgi:hypothetical protein